MFLLGLHTFLSEPAFDYTFTAKIIGSVKVFGTISALPPAERNHYRLPPAKRFRIFVVA